MINQEILSNIQNLKKEIYNTKLFSEYFNLKNELKNSITLQNTDKNIIFANYNSLNNEEKKRYAYIKMNSSKSPLLYNFFMLKEEVEDYIEEINKLLFL